MLYLQSNRAISFLLQFGTLNDQFVEVMRVWWPEPGSKHRMRM